MLRYPESNKVDLYSINEFVNDKSQVTLLGYKGPITVSPIGIILAIFFELIFVNFLDGPFR